MFGKPLHDAGHMLLEVAKANERFSTAARFTSVFEVVRHVLRLDLRMQRQLYRLNLEFDAVAMDLLRTDRRRHFFSLER
jgi:hypothetical protein